VPTIVSIHGTYAAGPEAGDQWWQRGSPFERRLRECIEATEGAISFQPLLWDGHNSEVSRRKAAASLLKRCEELEERAEPYVLIGHSHGGSVISNALLLASEAKLALPNLMQAVTVGTPFIHVAKRSALLSIAVPVLLIIVFLVALGAAVSSAITPEGFLNDRLIALDPVFKPKPKCSAGSQSIPEPPQGQLIKLSCSDNLWQSPLKIIERTYQLIEALAALFVIKLFIDERAKADHAIGPANIRRTSERYASRWLGLAHPLDEAIGGLSRVINAKPITLIPKLEENILAVFILLNLAVASIFVFIWFVLFSAANNSQPSLFSSGDHLPKPAVTIGEYLVQALKIGVPLAAILAACLLVVLVFKRLSLKWVGALIGDLMQRLLLRLDFPGQSATKISDRPMWSAQPPVSVPTDLAEQMTVFDDSQSLAAVEILRREFYSALKSNDSAALPNFSEVMAAFELAHKNYFSSPLFRTLIVAALTEQPAFRVKTVFATDPDFIRMREWLKSSREPERKRENR
jgi:hypothetical protein